MAANIRDQVIAALTSQYRQLTGVTMPGGGKMPVLRQAVSGSDAMSRGGPKNTEKKPAINMGIYRSLVLTSMDYRFFALSNKAEPLKQLGPDLIGKALTNAGIRVTTGQSTRRTFGKSKAAIHKRTKADPLVGVDQVEKLISSDPDGGLAWYWRMCNLDPDSPVPSERCGYVQWVVSKSPVAIRTIHHVCTNFKNNRRTLIMVDNPWTQQ